MLLSHVSDHKEKRASEEWLVNMDPGLSVLYGDLKLQSHHDRCHTIPVSLERHNIICFTKQTNYAFSLNIFILHRLRNKFLD